MSLPQSAPMPDLLPEIKKSAERFFAASKALSYDRSLWGVRMFTSLNLFLWHLDAFDKDEDPVPLFTQEFDKASSFLEDLFRNGVCQSQFLSQDSKVVTNKEFEEFVYGLFSDVWVDMSDDIYFDETYNFTKERLKKSGVIPSELFKDKIVLDAGCGSGKFSTAIAKFGAKKVIGVDLGKKGLEFAKKQALKISDGNKIEYMHGSLLDVPMEDSSVDMVWSNGVIHHTLDYEGCINEFSRVLKPGGTLFLYVNGRFGLFEVLQDTIRRSNSDIPKHLFQHYIKTLGVNSGRLYWLMDCLYAPYEYKNSSEVITLLEKNGFSNIQQLVRGVSSDQIEQVSMNIPYARVKYGEAQLKYLAVLD